MNKVTRNALLVAGLALSPLIVFAAPQNFAQLVDLIISLINPLVSILLALAILIFFWGIVKYIYAAGGGEGKNDGKKLMIWGIIGIFVFMSVFSLARILVKFIKGETTYIDLGTELVYRE